MKAPKVYVDIKVDGNGKVTDAGIARGTTTSNSSLRNIAIQKAKELKFPPSQNDVESGTILFVFVFKKLKRFFKPKKIYKFSIKGKYS